MSRHAAPLVFALALTACSASTPDAPATSPDRPPEHAAEICAVRSPCPALPEPTAEEVDQCVAVFADLAAPCRVENAALFVCSLRATRCTGAGELDEATSLEALEANCGEAQVRFERCCEGAGESVHCELLKAEEDAEGPPVEAPSEDAPGEGPASGETTG